MNQSIIDGRNKITTTHKMKIKCNCVKGILPNYVSKSFMVGINVLFQFQYFNGPLKDSVYFFKQHFFSHPILHRKFNNQNETIKFSNSF